MRKVKVFIEPTASELESALEDFLGSDRGGRIVGYGVSEAGYSALVVYAEGSPARREPADFAPLPIDPNPPAQRVIRRPRVN